MNYLEILLKFLKVVVSEIGPPFKSTDQQIRMKNHKATDRHPDPKQEELAALLQGYPDTPGKTSSMQSDRTPKFDGIRNSHRLG